MCIKHHYIHYQCKHPADAAHGDRDLVWSRPCNKALHDGDIYKAVKICEDAKTERRPLSVRFCNACTLDPDNFLTEEDKAYKEAADRRVSEFRRVDAASRERLKAKILAEKKKGRCA